VEMDRSLARGPAASAWEVVARANAAFRRANLKGTWDAVLQAERGLEEVLVRQPGQNSHQRCEFFEAAVGLKELPHTPEV